MEAQIQIPEKSAENLIQINEVSSTQESTLNLEEAIQVLLPLWPV